MSVPEVSGPCADCGSNDPCASFDERPLCYEHWHAAREATVPYWVRRDVSPEHDEKYGHMYFGGAPPSVLTETEAKEDAERMTARGRVDENGAPYERWVPVVAPNWWSGGRRAHPGYMQRRRAAVG